MADEKSVIEPTLINEESQDAPKAVSQEEKLFGKEAKVDVKEVEKTKEENKTETKAEETKQEQKIEKEKPEEKKDETKAEPSKTSTETKKDPVDYENLKLPNGSLLSVDELAEVKKVAKENGMSLEEAQGVLDVKNDAVVAFKARQEQSIVQANKTWKEEWLNDPEYGGAKAKESTELAKRAWNVLADGELKSWADQTGLGNYPPVLRLFARIGKLFSEDQLIRGSVGGQATPKSAEERLYGKTTPAAN